MSHKLFVAAGIFHPESGGPATYLYEILPRLQTLGWDIRVLTYGDGGTDDYPYAVQRIPRRALPLRQWDYARAANRLLAWGDVVYAHTIDLPLAGSRNVPRIIKIVGDQAWERCIRRSWIDPRTDIDTFQMTRYSPLVSWQQHSRSRQVRGMGAVIVPSRYLKRMVMGWGIPEEHIEVIYNALPPLDISNLPDQRTARSALGLDDRPTILTAARLNPWKGVDHLIEAVSRLPDVRLLVAGDGSEAPRLKQQAASLGDRVVFLGRIPRQQLYQTMRAADYFALYSGYEGLPHTLLESLRVGTPVIASDKGGCPEVVSDGVNGFLVPYVDVDALTAIIQQSTAPGQRQKLAAGTGTSPAHFQFDTMVAQTHAYLSRFR